MKKFIYKISFLIIVVGVIFIFFELFVFPYNNNQMRMKSQLLNTKKDSEILVLGNSHTFFGINPDESIFKMINIANKGRKLETDFYILKKYIKNFNNLSYVIIPISHYTLIAGELSIDEKRLYYQFYDLKKYKQGFFDNYLLFNEPFKELVDGIFLYDKKLHKSYITSKGFRPEKLTYNKNTVEVTQRIKAMEGDATTRGNFIKKNILYLDSLINLKKEYKLVLITPPYHKDYYDNYNKSYHVKIDSILTNMADKNNNTIYIKGKSLNIKNDILFKNSDHLNSYGAKVFTKKIDSILKTTL